MQKFQLEKIFIFITKQCLYMLYILKLKILSNNCKTTQCINAPQLIRRNNDSSVIWNGRSDKGAEDKLVDDRRSIVSDEYRIYRNNTHYI